jgi:hypothetical protein
VALILASVNQLPFHIVKIRTFFDTLADLLLTKSHDVYASVFLKLLAGRFDLDFFEAI